MRLKILKQGPDGTQCHLFHRCVDLQWLLLRLGSAPSEMPVFITFPGLGGTPPSIPCAKETTQGALSFPGCSKDGAAGSTRSRNAQSINEPMTCRLPQISSDFLNCSNWKSTAHPSVIPTLPCLLLLVSTRFTFCFLSACLSSFLCLMSFFRLVLSFHSCSFDLCFLY